MSSEELAEFNALKEKVEKLEQMITQLMRR